MSRLPLHSAYLLRGSTLENHLQSQINTLSASYNAADLAYSASIVTGFTAADTALSSSLSGAITSYTNELSSSLVGIIFGAATGSGASPASTLTGSYISASGNDFTDPTKLFLLDGNFNEEIDLDNLSGSAGDIIYSYSAVRDRQAGYFDGSTSLVYSGSNVGTYRDVSELSAVALVRVTTGSKQQMFYAVKGFAAAATDNNLHSFGIDDSNPPKLFYQHQSGDPGDEINATSDARLLLNEWYVVGFTRNAAATSVTFYVNGIAAGTSSSLSAPTGGDNSYLTVGAFADAGSAQVTDGNVACLAFLFSGSWTAAEHLAIAKQIFPYR